MVTGIPELDAKLRKMPLTMQKKLFRKSLRKATKEIALPQALGDVPVRTGKLRRSLVVRAIKRSRTRIGHMVQTKEGVYDGEGGDQFPGAFLEFGTKERITKPRIVLVNGEEEIRYRGHRTGRIEPKKFGYLRRSVYDNELKTKNLVVDDVQELIRENEAK